MNSFRPSVDIRENIFLFSNCLRLSFHFRNKYAFRTEPYTDFELNLRPHKIGIFVDYEKGEVKDRNIHFSYHNTIEVLLKN